MMLAGDLAEAGVHVTVLERRTNESNVTRAFAVHARTMEELKIRGLAYQLAATGTTIRELRLFGTIGIDLARLPSEFAALLITLDTVKRHVSHVFGKLGVANRTQAVARARRLGLLP